MKKMIETEQAPKPIGTYSPAIEASGTVYLSGQLPVDPATTVMASGAISQIKRVFDNIKIVAEAAGGSLDHIVKLTVYLSDIQMLSMLNDTMPQYFKSPFPARTAVAVAALPRGALIEIDAIMHI